MSGPLSVLCSELLERTAAGDRQAFRTLYQSAGPKLFAITLRMMRGREEAEDVLQDAFVKIWEKSWQYDPAKGDALAWLATVTRHAALDRLRKQPKSHVAFDEAVVEEIDGAMVPGGPDLGEAHDLQRCLSALRADYRKAVVLAYVNGLTHEELAEQLGKPIGTVKSWVRRGLDQLKGCMAG
jgi:RNA polymerase sigma-70 factor (ECF subfamily)